MKMLHNLSAWFYRKTSIFFVLAFLALYMIMVAVILPGFEKSLATHTPLKIFDLRFGFSPDEAYTLLDGLGEAGRAQYRLLEMSVDVIYPFIYTGFFVLLISLIYRNILPPTAKLRMINLLPFAIMLFDFLENTGIVLLINRFPARADALVGWVSCINQLKWLLFAAVVVTTVFGLGMAAIANLRKRRARK
ncbi:MAG: hypothetical protein KF852_05275 [Saprospiraceae bacterium]|nr:hypothetical protein [Saprospiraceae bacterium]